MHRSQFDNTIGRNEKVASVLRMLVLFIVVIIVIFMVFDNYSLIFAKNVNGEILDVERVIPPAVLGLRSVPDSQLYSFAVAVRNADGEIFTASSEEKEWAVAKKGFCAEAKFYPFPPWNFAKQGKYMNARLIKLLDCKTAGVSALPSPPPVVEAPTQGDAPGNPLPPAFPTPAP